MYFNQVHGYGKKSAKTAESTTTDIWLCNKILNMPTDKILKISVIFAIVFLAFLIFAGINQWGGQAQTLVILDQELQRCQQERKNLIEQNHQILLEYNQVKQEYKKYIQNIQKTKEFYRSKTDPSEVPNWLKGQK